MGMMTFETLQKSAQTFRPAFWLDETFPSGLRKAFRRILYAVVILSFVLALEIFTSGTGNFLSIVYLAAAVLGVLIAFEIFHASLKYRELPDGMTFELARILWDTSRDDITRGLLLSEFGAELMLRLGLEEEIKKFFDGRKTRISETSFSVAAEKLSLVEYTQAVAQADAEFKAALFAAGVLEADLSGAAEWIERGHTKRNMHAMWWSRRNLSKIPGLGKGFSYGQVWLLEKYGGKFSLSHDVSGLDTSGSYHAEEVEELELALSRSSEANAMVVAEDESGDLDVVGRLAKLLLKGSVHPALEHKQMYMLDPNALIAATGEKAKFESEMMRLMKESIKAGNIILVIPDFPAFMASAASLGSNLVSILDPYLSSSALQVIALADVMSFHQVIETNSALMQRFEKITVKSGGGREAIRLLEDKAAALEGRSGIAFTYQALAAIAESADRYIVNGTMPDKAVDLLIECVPAFEASGTKIILKQNILDFVETKTGIPVAGVKDAEREKLTNLESILRTKVVGQEVAIDAISDAMRRSRAGISNPNRPMGSFLFIGPTGVGKTETTKALAEVFFGSADKIVRFDMSEYSAPDALSRLIGSFEIGKAGTLTTALRENPYGVLLLDEFEKASREVHDLFLQILDEGVFSDMVGKKVNARNLIIIATSNAGSDLIWQLSQSGLNRHEPAGRTDLQSKSVLGKDIAQAKDTVIDDIIKQGIFRPELINRFDGVILFHALGENELRSVARIQLERLKSRLAERTINLTINDALIDFLVEQGNDPKFGARPLNRAIEDDVEAVIAKKIIAGGIAPGAEVVLTGEDLKSHGAVHA